METFFTRAFEHARFSADISLPRRRWFSIKRIECDGHTLHSFKVHESNLLCDCGGDASGSRDSAAELDWHVIPAILTFQLSMLIFINIRVVVHLLQLAATIFNPHTYIQSSRHRHSEVENISWNLSNFKLNLAFAAWFRVFLYDSVPLIALCDIFTWKMFPVGQREYRKKATIKINGARFGFLIQQRERPKYLCDFLATPSHMN